MSYQAKIRDKRIDEIEPVEGGFLMVHLKDGYCLNDQGCHTFGEDTMKEVRATMKRVKPCLCFECALDRERMNFAIAAGWLPERLR